MSSAFSKLYDIDLSMEVVTPHENWGKPLAGGPVSAFFVPSIQYGREVIELAQRFDITYDSVIIDRNWDYRKWGLGDFYDLCGGIWDDAIVMQNLENAVCSDTHFDVMFIPGINGWRRFSDKTKDAILRRVEEGAGLVINCPRNGVDLPEVEGSMPALHIEERDEGVLRPPTFVDPWLEKLTALTPLHEEGYVTEGYSKIDFDVLKREQWEFAEHYITNGFPQEILDCSELAYYPYKAAGDVIIKASDGSPIMAVRTVGKGRVVSIGWQPTVFLPLGTFKPPIDGSCMSSITMGSISPEKNTSFDINEYFYALTGRVMLWAAGRDNSVITGVIFSGTGDELTVKTNEPCDLEYRIKNRYDDRLSEGSAV